MFLDWLKMKKTVVILCGDHGQPPPFGSISPDECLKDYVDYYEEMTTDRISLDEELTTLKANIRCTNNRNQGRKLREAIPKTSLEEFYNTWKPTDMIVASRKKVRYIIMKKLFYLHGKKFPN